MASLKIIPFLASSPKCCSLQFVNWGIIMLKVLWEGRFQNVPCYFTLAPLTNILLDLCPSKYFFPRFLRRWPIYINIFYFQVCFWKIHEKRKLKTFVFNTAIINFTQNRRNPSKLALVPSISTKKCFFPIRTGRSLCSRCRRNLLTFSVCSMPI